MSEDKKLDRKKKKGIVCRYSTCKKTMLYGSYKSHLEVVQKDFSTDLRSFDETIKQPTLSGFLPKKSSEHVSSKAAEASTSNEGHGMSPSTSKRPRMELIEVQPDEVGHYSVGRLG